MVRFDRGLRVVFYRSATGREPVREWLQGLDRETRRILGEDIKTVQLGWPLGMPLVRSLGDGLWELRNRVPCGTARLVFLAERDLLVLLHAFIKKSRKAPPRELEIARRRAAEVRRKA